ncbi:putative Ig domain-containing protein, partial [Streptomyces sp. NPDC005522]
MSHSPGTDTNGSVTMVAPHSGQLLKTVTVGKDPYSMAESNGFLYVVNRASDSVSVIDLKTNTKVRDVAVSASPRNVAAGPDGSIYVTHRLAGVATITKLDGSNLDATPKSVNIYHDVADDTGCIETAGLVVDPNPGNPYLYVLCRRSTVVANEPVGSLVRVDTDDFATHLYRGGAVISDSVAISADGNRFYSADAWANEPGPRVQYIKLQDHDNFTSAPVSRQGFSNSTTLTTAIALDPTGNSLYAVGTTGGVSRFKISGDLVFFNNEVPAAGSGLTDIAADFVRGRLDMSLEFDGNVQEVVRGGNTTTLDVTLNWDFPDAGPAPLNKAELFIDGVDQNKKIAPHEPVSVTVDDLTPGQHEFKAVYSTDAQYAESSATAVLTVHDNLRLDTATLPDAIAGQPYSGSDGLQLSASGGWGGYRWSAVGLPTGLTLSQSGKLSGTVPVSGPVGTRNVEVTLLDSPPGPGRNTVTQTFTLRTVAVLRATPVDVIRVTQGANLHIPLDASGGASPYLWGVAPPATLPPGLSLSPATGEITGTAPTAGPYGPIQIEVTDTTSPQQFDLLALSVTVTDPLSIPSSPALPDAVAGDPYTRALTTVGGSSSTSDTGTITWDSPDNPTGLPAGISLDSDGHLTGTPTTPGTYRFRVRAIESGNPYQDPTSATNILTLTVLAKPVITTTSLPDGVVGQDYSQSLTASPTGTYLWSAPDESLPDWLTLSGAGLLTGRPTQAGRYSFTVTTTDAVTALSAHTTLAITVHDPLSITTSSLPAGTTGSPYNHTLEASGGTSPYTWAITTGSLPTGLTLAPSTGAITGTPTTATGDTPLTLTVTVTDTNGQNAHRDLTLTINDPPAITTSSLPAGTTGSPYNHTLEASGGTSPYTWA